LQIGEFQQKLIADLVKTEVQRLGLANQVASLSRAKSGYKQRADVLPRLQEGQRDLERQLEAAQLTYQTLLKNLQEVRIAENQNVGNATVMAYALVPDRPIASKKKLILVGGVVAGSLLYVVTAFLLDLRDPSIKTAKEVRQLFRYTWLGMIPDWKKKGIFPGRKLEEIVPQLPVIDAPHSVSSEAYRMLQANLEFLNPDKELKVIVVTSSVSKEGKSTVSANLATAMAKLGRRVLLIDADMRHPMQHHIWDLANAVGLSDVIVNQAEFKMAVREVMDNLDVLPSGVIPPDSLALLKSKRMGLLIEEFSKSYNFVIFDTPPLVLVADAITLGKMTDGMLLVSRPGVIDRVSAAASKGFLVQSNQAVLGLVVNGVNVENEPDSYFHHAKTYYKEELTTSKVAKSKTGKKNSKGF
jgi:capsular exopolysaccharide synthesis family protein